jgi:glycerol dehydrogenase
MVPIRKMVMPMNYIQGKGAIYYLGQKARPYGNRAYVIGEKVALSIAGERVRKSLESNGIEIAAMDDSAKECTHKSIERLANAGRRLNVHFVVGVGGGKALDTAKAVAMNLGVPAITVGTQCATNADGSGESIVYTENHEFLEDLRLPRNPVLVIEDTEILAKAPVRFLVQGMGDALACKFEAEMYRKARMKKKDGEVPSTAALALAEACYQSLMVHGTKAVKDLKNGIHSAEVDEIIEAVKFASALAFENTGCALAHALHNGLTKTRQVRGEHGEIVAYCTLVQAVYEKRPREEIAKMVEWCSQVGLPTKLSMLGEISKPALRQAAEHACRKDPDVANMPDKVKPADLLKAIEDLERGNF